MLQRSALSRIERSAGASTSQSVPAALWPPVQRPRGRAQRRRVRASPELVDALSQLAVHLPLEQIAAPCQVMKCGDIVYRSTLDPAHYKTGGFDWRTATLLATVLGYLFLPPGVLPGAFDYYIKAPLKRRESRVIDKNDIILGKRLGTGGFGTVYKGELKEEGGGRTPIIIKKAKEFGEAEVWMNERMSRVPGNHTAEFVTAFDESLSATSPPPPSSSAAGGAAGAGGGAAGAGAAAGNRAGAAAGAGAGAGGLDGGAIWLVWYYEGDNTLMSLMERREFPYNLEPLLFGRELRAPRGPAREAVTVKEAMRQLLAAVAACHANGIVHRDIKPANAIISSRDRKLKLIDLGAAADLRIGINYVPNEYLLDPRYAPPQQYIMSTQTPHPPPKPVAAFLSPVLWAMERPDRFDMYSCGVTMLQLVFPHLRNDNTLCAFNKRLQDLKWDLAAWRREEAARLASGAAKGQQGDSLATGFAALDAEGGAGWDLLSRLMAYTPADRPSAAEALAHPWLSSAPGRAASRQGSLTAAAEAAVGSAAAATSAALSNAGRSLGRAAEVANMTEAILKTQQGALTEAQLLEELGLQEPAPLAPREGSQTIAWWQQRQGELRARLVERRERLRQQVSSAVNSVRGVRQGGGGGGAGAAGGGSGKAGGGKWGSGEGAAAAGAAVAAAAAASSGSGKMKLKVPMILGGVAAAKRAPGSGGYNAAPANNNNGNGNGANGNGKAVASNGNGKYAAASNGNGNGNGNGVVGRGKGSTPGAVPAAAAANGNGFAKAISRSFSSYDGGDDGGEEGYDGVVGEEQEQQRQGGVSAKEKVFDLLGVFRR
ncbi:hypothetical protein Agub_g8295 [Astrephomene gubernaculifera]|uniref:Protein kinase domain-containing protein n=1 Tax=Astrephomene gubernaculifera TaxID=47775 RepID=A0AAD3DRS1_9CHLO|nr:hypothetical protein Agub_g8295 [Astrephomene gubernaculifera]